MDAERLQNATLNRCLVACASPYLTFFLLLGLAASILWGYFAERGMASLLAGSLLLLAINLLAAVATHARLRQTWPLLVFHLSLLAIILLVALGRLVYLKGQAEVLEGTEFDSQVVKVDAGPWHPWALDQVRFVNLGFSIAYAPGQVRLGTENRVGWVDQAGRQQEAVIGDHHPLVLRDYHFYTTWNKGFALLFEWHPANGPMTLGSVNLPSYPVNELKQAQQWHLPGLAEPVWAMLQFDGDLIPQDQGGAFRLPTDYRVVVRHGDRRWEISPEGGGVDLPGGHLRYVGLRSWMGYLVTWDATLPWLLLASGIAVAALGWHFWTKFAGQPWNPD